MSYNGLDTVAGARNCRQSDVRQIRNFRSQSRGRSARTEKTYENNVRFS